MTANQPEIRLTTSKDQAKLLLGVKGLHLEVARDNQRTKLLYAKHGFESRDRYHMMSLPLKME
jgi:ribosomal protein S18 acetylase RimI-like enzyme